jgi:hypothetical protein
VPTGSRLKDKDVETHVIPTLRQHGNWLLIFDNAERLGDIKRWLPGNGHVLITSRSGGWEEIAAPVSVDVLERAESVELLQKRIPGFSEPDAALVAEATGEPGA